MFHDSPVMKTEASMYQMRRIHRTLRNTIANNSSTSTQRKSEISDQRFQIHGSGHSRVLRSTMYSHKHMEHKRIYRILVALSHNPRFWIGRSKSQYTNLTNEDCNENISSRMQSGVKFEVGVTDIENCIPNVKKSFEKGLSRSQILPYRGRTLLTVQPNGEIRVQWISGN